MIAVGSVRGAPGATTLALALGLVSANRVALVVEADPSGGVLAARRDLGLEPGLVSLAAVRRDMEASEVLAHSQVVVPGLRVVCGPATPHQARAALAMGAERLAARLHRLDEDVVIDVGRLDDVEFTAPLLRSARRLLLVVRPDLESLQSLGSRLDALASATGVPIDVVTVGEVPYRSSDVSALVGTAHNVYPVPADTRSADALNGRRALGRIALQRSALLRAAAHVRRSVLEVNAHVAAGSRQ